MDDILVGKVAISASLKKIHFPKISDQAPLNNISYLYDFCMQNDRIMSNLSMSMAKTVETDPTCKKLQDVDVIFQE